MERCPHCGTPVARWSRYSYTRTLDGEVDGIRTEYACQHCGTRWVYGINPDAPPTILMPAETC